jgi:hypothetical protein
VIRQRQEINTKNTVNIIRAKRSYILQMNTKITTEKLAVWIAGIKECAKQDDKAQVWWFVPTWNKPFCIVAGWQKMFTNGDFSDVFCCSKSRPEYAMCLKIVVNDGKLDPDFASLTMPVDKNNEVDDTCVPLEWDDNPECAAEFFMHEFERIMEEHGEEI